MAAKESAEVNRKRAPSGPVKVVTNQPRRHTGVDLVSGLRPYWRGSGELGQQDCAMLLRRSKTGPPKPQEVSFSCPHRVFEGLQREAADQVLQAVKFTDKNAPGLSLALDEEFQAANCFSELTRG